MASSSYQLRKKLRKRKKVCPSETYVVDLIDSLNQVRSMQVVLPESSLSRDYIKMFNNKLLSDVAFLGKC